MKRVRLCFLVMLAWMFVFYNIERLHKPINLASFVYVAAAMFSLVLIASPRLQRLPLPWLLAIPVPILVAVKAWLGYPIAGVYLPLTITELGAVELTIVLSRRIGQSLEESSLGVRDALVGRFDGRPMPFANGQAEMYRELRRARSFQRPVALLAVAPEQAGDKQVLDRFLAELERETVHEYVSAQVAELLGEHLRDYDVVVRRDGHFLTLLPEADRQQAAAIAEKLAASAREKLGIDLKIGLSVFPEEEVTLVGLLDRAEASLGTARPPRTPHTGNGRVVVKTESLAAVAASSESTTALADPPAAISADGGDDAPEKPTHVDRPR